MDKDGMIDWNWLIIWLVIPNLLIHGTPVTDVS